MSLETRETWFPEPPSTDDTFARRGEQTLEWLTRSTNTRARECRRFLNEHISKLPLRNQAKLVHDLREKWHSTFFELITARILQELGASFFIEDANPDGKQPDFRAQFQDAIVTVEATAPTFDAPTDEELRARIPLLNFIESKAPEGWRVGVWELPNIGFSDPQKQFKSKVKRMLNVPTPTVDDTDREITEKLPQGTIHLHLFPTCAASKRLGFEAPIILTDDTRWRILSAVKHKRQQVCNSHTPVLLAILASGSCSDLEDFDVALFGRSYERCDQPRQLVETGFKPDGIFNKRSDKNDPSFAGVLAFLKAGFNCCSEPVLYRHPRFSGILPEALLQLEQRTYNKATNEICRERSTIRGLVETLNLVNV